MTNRITQRKIIASALRLGLCLPLFVSASDNIPQDDNTAIVHLRTNCNEIGQTIFSCFESMPSLQSWIDNIRVRTENNPLVVEIGPGTFSSFTCFGTGYITLKGAGKSHSVIEAPNPFGTAIFLGANCHLNVQDLTVRSGDTSFTGAISLGGLTSGLAGETHWNNVDVFGTNYGWTDSQNDVDSNGNTSKHFWTNSRIFVTPGLTNIARGYSTPAENWFFATQITATATSSDTYEAIALLAKFGANVHVYGGNIRAIAEPGVFLDPATMTNPSIYQGLVAVGAGGKEAAGVDVEVHIHGTGIDILSAESNHIAAIVGGSSAPAVHATGASYSMKTGPGGSLTRISDEGGLIAKASYMWEQSDSPPNISSIDGADVFMETYCSTVCDDLGSGNESHILVYDTDCIINGPWLDTVTGLCRGEAPSSSLASSSGDTPPSALVASTGSVMFIETDCSIICDDLSSGSELHILIYDINCNNAGPWLDRKTGECRGIAPT